MNELIVLILTTTAIIFVICGFMNRKRHREQDEMNSIDNRIEIGNTYGFSSSEIRSIDLFKDELSRAGFSDEAIEDMRAKVSAMKGSVSVSDAVNIIRALDPIMKLRKDF